MKPINLLLALSVLLLAACVTAQQYEYIAPSDAAGLSCVEDCQSAREECLQEVTAEYDSCRDLYIYDDKRFSDCKTGRRGIEHDGGGGCPVPQICAPPNTLKCTKAYNQCYQDCGGILK